MIALKLQNISKYYASQTAVVMGLSDVNLSFSVGEFVAVTGENGSGKSTLANVIGGMLPYENGELYVMGQPTSHYNAADWERYRRDLIGFISQDYGILPGNTVFENVESALILSGCDKASAKEKTRGILKQVELSEYSRRRAAKLSSGQKQRLAIARALAKPSKILIADEPTGNLDRENSDKVIRLLKEASEDRLVILITHEFSEAKAYITRHVVLSDGKVVQDTDMGAAPAPGAEDEPAERPERRAKNRFGTSLYVAGLTAKARPVFFFFTLLILLLTCVAAFIFIGNFVAASDDTSSRVYDSRGFINGDRAILDQKYVRSAEFYGYVSDVSYLYREGTDFITYYTADYAEDYDPETNPDAFTYTIKYKYLNKDPLFIRSVLQAGSVTDGVMPEGFYEILSADPNYKTGSQVEVLIKDKRHWATSEYFKFTFDVVGETAGKGLYFSESFCKMMNNATLNLIYNRNNEYDYGGDLGKNPVAPYYRERFADDLLDVSEIKFPDETPALPPRPNEEYEPDPTPEPTPEPTPPMELADDEYISAHNSSKALGYELELNVGSGWNTGVSDGVINNYELFLAWQFESKHPRLVLVNPEVYESMIRDLGSNQVSVFITDYAYTDRVIDEMSSLGYLAVSPYRQGSTTVDEKFEAERIKLLRVSLAASVLTLVLQLILLKVTFGSLKDLYKLLSNMGLRAKTAYASLAWLFAVLTLIAEALGAAVILLLNHYGYSRVVNIFKYLETPKLILIFAVHFVFCVISYFIVVRSLKKQVFTISGCEEDLDGELMEEVLGE